MSSKKATRVARAYIDWQVAKRGAVASLRQKENLFNPDTFLSTIGMGRKLRFSSKHTIYAQGTASDAVFYIQKGNVKIMSYLPMGRKRLSAC
jgi:hypothetical protein